MLNLNTKEIIFSIKMPIDPTYKVISFHTNLTSKEVFIITGIDDSDINKINHSCNLHLKRGNCTFNVTPDNIFCYGDIDFNEGSEDSATLDTFNWLDHLDAKGVPIPSNYNYDKHECTTNKKFILWTETFKNSVLCRYLHGCLGKPKFTLIFKETV